MVLDIKDYQGNSPTMQHITQSLGNEDNFLLLCVFWDARCVESDTSTDGTRDTSVDSLQDGAVLSLQSETSTCIQIKASMLSMTSLKPPQKTNAIIGHAQSDPFQIFRIMEK